MVLTQNNIVNSGIYCRMTYGKVLLYVKLTGKPKDTCKYKRLKYSIRFLLPLNNPTFVQSCKNFAATIAGYREFGKASERLF